MCPRCKSALTKKRGYFFRNSGKSRKIQRFFCNHCLRSFSTETDSLTYREVKPHFTQPVFRLLDAGVSERKSAELLGIHRRTVHRKLKRLGLKARIQTAKEVSTADTVVFDEMETFEHTKCKPVAIVVAVEEGTRRLLCCRVASMPAKGRLAEISRRKYGFRKDDRPQALAETFRYVKAHCPSLKTIKSDQSPRYTKRVARYLPSVTHITYKGRRGCVVGQGELKRGGYDPLFSLNHTCAMIRDNIKRLSRRTWCTTKDPSRLQDLLDMYCVYHNAKIDLQPRLIAIEKGGCQIQ